MTLDERWDTVCASVGVPQGYFYEDENQQFNPLELTEFLIEVQWGDSVYYARQIADRRDLEDARFDLYRFTLDKMVEQIDHYMNVAKGEANG